MGILSFLQSVVNPAADQPSEDPSGNKGLFGFFGPDQQFKWQQAMAQMSALGAGKPYDGSEAANQYAIVKMKRQETERLTEASYRIANNLRAAGNSQLADEIDGNPEAAAKYMGEEITSNFDPNTMFYKDFMNVGNQPMPDPAQDQQPQYNSPVQPGVSAPMPPQQTGQQVRQVPGLDPRIVAKVVSTYGSDLTDSEIKMMALSARGGGSGMLNTYNMLMDNRARKQSAEDSIAYRTRLAEDKKQAADDAKAEEQAMVDEYVKGVKEFRISPDLKGVIKYRVPIMTGLSKAGVNVAQLQEDWAAAQRQIASLNGPQQTRMRQAVSQVDYNLGILQDLAKKWDGGGYPDLNAVNLAIAKRNGSDPKGQTIATLFENHVKLIANELASSLRGGYAITDDAQAMADTLLDPSWSRQTFEAALRQIKNDIKIRENSLAQPAVGTGDNPYQITVPAPQPLTDATVDPDAPPSPDTPPADIPPKPASAAQVPDAVWAKMSPERRALFPPDEAPGDQ